MKYCFIRFQDTVRNIINTGEYIERSEVFCNLLSDILIKLTPKNMIIITKQNF